VVVRVVASSGAVALSCSCFAVLLILVVVVTTIEASHICVSVAVVVPFIGSIVVAVVVASHISGLYYKHITILNDNSSIINR